MDTPIFDALLAELLVRRNGRGWPTVDLDPPPKPGDDLPTWQQFALPPEMFTGWSEVVHAWGAHRGLFRSAVVASASAGGAL